MYIITRFSLIEELNKMKDVNTMNMYFLDFPGLFFQNIGNTIKSITAILTNTAVFLWWLTNIRDNYFNKGRNNCYISKNFAQVIPISLYKHACSMIIIVPMNFTTFSTFSRHKTTLYIKLFIAIDGHLGFNTFPVLGFWYTFSLLSNTSYRVQSHWKTSC